MLRRYGSTVDDSTLTKLVSAFSELRQMADEGLIAYPYSTREVVNIVKHMEVGKHSLSVCVCMCMCVYVMYIMYMCNVHAYMHVYACMYVCTLYACM